jgi:hypothetical protein
LLSQGRFNQSRPLEAISQDGHVAVALAWACDPGLIYLTESATVLWRDFAPSEQHDFFERSDDERRTAQHSWRGAGGSMAREEQVAAWARFYAIEADSRPGELEYDRALAAAKRLEAEVAKVVQQAEDGLGATGHFDRSQCIPIEILRNVRGES